MSRLIFVRACAGGSAPRMDPLYVKGLREAKAQVDAGTLTPEEFEKEKKRLLAQREEREKEVLVSLLPCSQANVFFTFFYAACVTNERGVVCVEPCGSRSFLTVSKVSFDSVTGKM